MRPAAARPYVLRYRRVRDLWAADAESVQMSDRSQEGLHKALRADEQRLIRESIEHLKRELAEVMGK